MIERLIDDFEVLFIPDEKTLRYLKEQDCFPKTIILHPF